MRTARLAVLLIAAGCASAPPAVPASAPAAAPRPTWGPARASTTAPVDVLLDLGLLDAAAALGLGAPLRVEAEPVENRHVAGQIDTVRTYVWQGLEVSDYETAPGKTLRLMVRARDARFRDTHGLGLGATRPAVQAALGDPLHTFEDGTVNYLYRDTPDWTTLNVTYRDGLVDTIAWVPEVD